MASHAAQCNQSNLMLPFTELEGESDHLWSSLS